MPLPEILAALQREEMKEKSPIRDAAIAMLRTLLTEAEEEATTLAKRAKGWW